jgi:hypothetical protein
MFEVTVWKDTGLLGKGQLACITKREPDSRFRFTALCVAHALEEGRPLESQGAGVSRLR